MTLLSKIVYVHIFASLFPMYVLFLRFFNVASDDYEEDDDSLSKKFIEDFNTLFTSRNKLK